MIVEVDGASFEVPDDATPEEIDALTRQASGPAPKEPPKDLGAWDAANRAVGRAVFAIPGLVGLDNARAQAINEWVTNKVKGGPDLPNPITDDTRTNAYRQTERTAEAQHPWATGGGLAVGQLPATLLGGAALNAAGLAPQSLSALQSAVSQGALTGTQEIGMTQGYPTGERAARVGASFAGGALPGGVAPTIARNAENMSLKEAASGKVPQSLSEWLRDKSGERAIKAAGGIQSDITRARKQISPNSAVGREALTDIGAEFVDLGIVTPGANSEKVFERAFDVATKAGEDIGQVLTSADASGGGFSLSRFLRRGRELANSLRAGADPEARTAADAIDHRLDLIAQSYGGSRPATGFGVGTQGSGAQTVVRPGAPTTRTETVFGVGTGGSAGGNSGSYVRTITVPGKPQVDILGGAPEQPTYRSSTPAAAEIPFSQAHALRMEIDDGVWGKLANNIPWASRYKSALSQLRQIASEEIESGLDQYAPEAAKSPAWRDANRRYQVAMRAQEFADKGMDRAHGNNQVSLTELMAGLTGAGLGVPLFGAEGASLGIPAMIGTAVARRYGSGVQATLASKLAKLTAPVPGGVGGGRLPASSVELSRLADFLRRANRLGVSPTPADEEGSR